MKGGRITIVFSFFGLPKYLSVKSKSFHSFIPAYLLVAYLKYSIFTQETVLEGQWKGQHWIDFFDSMKNCSKIKPLGR